MSREAPTDLIAVGQRVVDLALGLGADEVTAGVGYSIYTDLGQRDGALEKSQESRSLSVSVDLLVADRSSSHSTSDLRPDALQAFLKRAVDATRYLEPDARRRLPPREEMGAADVRALDLDDMGWPPDSAAERRAKVAALEARCREVAADAPVRSLSVNWWDGRIDSGMVTSNGFSSRWQRTSMGYGGSITLEEPGGRLPEGYQYCAARHSEDLMSFDDVATALLEQGTRRMKSTAAPSGRYAMLLDKQVVGQLMRVLIGPLGGTAVYEGRSCLKDKLGARIAPEGFSIIDDPLIPRALGSRPYTGDGFPSMQRAVLEDGVLRTFFISLYNARRLGVAPTTGGASNLVIAPGDQSPEALMKAAGRVIRVEGFLGGNTSEITGDFSFGVNGTLFENGEPVQAVSEMNISGNLFELMERWQAAADDVWTYSAWRSPSLLFDDIQFSGT